MARLLSVRGSGRRIEALESHLRRWPDDSRAENALEKTRLFREFAFRRAKWLQAHLDVSVARNDRHGNPVTTGDLPERDGGKGWPREITLLCDTEAGPVPPMEFVLVPAGGFLMGGEGYFEPGPRHRVEFKHHFYMGKYPVTQAQWRAVMGENTSYFKASGPDAPVDSVSWDDARYFISELSGLIEVPEGWKRAVEIRLPSEAEWEYACRAGSSTLYHSGDDEEDLHAVGWFWRNSETRTHPVGRLKPNAWGFYDMHGNVWEWCEDAWHDDYHEAPVDGSPWVEGGSSELRVLRGGAWYVMFRGCSSRFRCPIKRLDRHYSVGFRLVLKIEAWIETR